MGVGGANAGGGLASETGMDEAALLALVERARGGDAGAGQALAARARPLLARWALARTGDAAAAEDVAQSVLLRLDGALARFDGRSRFTTWLFRVCANAATAWQRREAAEAARRERLGAVPRDPPAGGGAAAAAADRVSDARAAALVRHFFTMLPAGQRQVFDLVDLQGYTPTEAAEMLELSAGTARAHLFRARRSIRQRILEWHPEIYEDYRQ